MASSLSSRPLLSRRSSLLFTGLFTGFALLVAASSVYGGPPAAADSPPDNEAPADPAPASSDGPLAPTAVSDAEELPVDIDSELSASADAATGPLRTRMEDGMASIGGLAVDARKDEDLVRAACVLDKQERANDVMELGTSELLVIRDPNTSAQARQFAVEKLQAAADRVDGLVSEARECAGKEGPEEQVDATRNESEEPRTIPIWDPSAGLGDSPVTLSLDSQWPLVASPIE